MSATLTSVGTCVGRPRSEDADSRILNAALTLYGAVGWAGFNLTKVATLAGVGKSSMYSRWPEREELLLDAFRELIQTPRPTGDTVWDILINEGIFRVNLYVGERSQAIRRVFVETGGGEPVIAAIYEHLYVKPIGELRDRLWEFKSNGYLPQYVSVTRLLDAIEGSILMRGFCIPPENVSCFLTEIPEYVDALVSDQLRFPVNSPSLKRLHAVS